MAKAKKIEGLDCAAPAREGVRLVLEARFEEMLSYRAAALDFSDIEGVHDMRVASRRLRSALRDFAPHLRRAKRLERVRARLKELADALGGVRDADVALIALEGLAGEAPDQARAGVRGLAGGRGGPHEAAREKLREALAERELDELRLRFGRAVEEACAPPRRRGRGGADGEAGDIFAGLGRAVVAGLWEELRDLSPGLYRPHRQRRLHKMRIAAKRLRYALELFSPCFGGGAKGLCSEISELQEALGELHDCDVWVEQIGGLLARGAGAPARADSGGEGEDGSDLWRAAAAGAGRAAEEHHGADGSEARAGLVWLLDRFVERRARHYGEALRLWHEWERDDFAGRLAACAVGEGDRPQHTAGPEAGAEVLREGSEGSSGGSSETSGAPGG